MGYFKWRGGFFYRVWHLNAKYYSNSTTTVRSFRECVWVSLSILPLSAYTDLSFCLPSPLSFLYFPPSRYRYSCYSHLCGVVHRAPHGTRGFISWYSNALKHHTRPTRRHQCVTRSWCHCRGFRTDKSYCRYNRHRDNARLRYDRSLYSFVSAPKNADPRGSGKITRS